MSMRKIRLPSGAVKGLAALKRLNDTQRRLDVADPKDKARLKKDADLARGTLLRLKEEERQRPLLAKALLDYAPAKAKPKRAKTARKRK